MKFIASKKDSHIFFIFIGVFLLIAAIAVSFYHWYEEKDHSVATILELNKINNEDIKSIVIDRYAKRKKYSLVTDEISIGDSRKIKRIWDSISFSEKYEPHHPSPKWKCFLKINLKNGRKVVLVINRLKSSKMYDDRGAMITIWTHVDAGNIIGQFRSDALAPILEAIAKEDKQYNKHVDT